MAGIQLAQAREAGYARGPFMRTRWLNTLALVAVAASAILVVLHNRQGGRSHQLLNVSYDATRELYQDLNKQWIGEYSTQTGQRWTIQQSHGGSSRQARAVRGMCR